MKVSKNIRFTLMGTLCLFSLVACSPGVVKAQTSSLPAQWRNKQISLRGKQQSFADYIANLSRQIGCNIIVDDEPQILLADVDVQGLASHVLDELASAFDYQWHVNRKGVIIMTKRFKSRDSLPQMNVAEMRQTSAEILSALSEINTSVQFGGSHSPLKLLYDSFTQEQLAELGQGKPLLARDLQPFQRSFVEQSILANSYGDFRATWQRLASELNGISASFLRLIPPENTRRALTISPQTQNIPFQKGLYYVWQDKSDGEQTAPLLTNSAFIHMIPFPINKEKP